MNSLDHVGIYVKDLKRSEVFYEQIFGFRVSRRMKLGKSKITFLDIAGGLLELIQRPDAPGEAPKGKWGNIAIKVDDYDAIESKLIGIGLELREINLSDGSRIAFFKDPDGHEVEILE
jgi:catechol 2,3-dioxygenase-like lactoylglutathione lyase family enzyme